MLDSRQCQRAVHRGGLPVHSWSDSANISSWIGDTAAGRCWGRRQRDACSPKTAEALCFSNRDEQSRVFWTKQCRSWCFGKRVRCAVCIPRGGTGTYSARARHCRNASWHCLSRSQPCRIASHECHPRSSLRRTLAAVEDDTSLISRNFAIGGALVGHRW